MYTIDDYQELIDLYKMNINNGKCGIQNCSFINRQYNQMFGFKITHQVGIDNIYQVSNMDTFINKNCPKYTYAINGEIIKSNEIFNFDDIINRFKNQEVKFSNCLMVVFDHTKGFLYVSKIDENLEKSSINHGNNRVDFFRFKHPDFKFPEYIIHIKYMDKWFKIISKDSNSCKTSMYLTSYVGDNMPKEYFHFVSKINSFNYNNILDLFDEKSFNEIMSNIETEIVFS